MMSLPYSNTTSHKVGQALSRKYPMCYNPFGHSEKNLQYRMVWSWKNCYSKQEGWSCIEAHPWRSLGIKQVQIACEGYCILARTEWTTWKIDSELWTSVGKYVPQGCLPPPQLPPSQPITNLWHNFLPSGKYVHPRDFPLLPPHLSKYFGAIFSCQILAPKLVNIAFSLRLEEASLMLTSHKFVSIYFHYL